MNDDLFEMVDGYFSAKRFNGISEFQINEPLYRDTFFLKNPHSDDVLVDSRRAGCPNFRAGDNVTKSNDRCDISGIFGGVCPHGCPWLFYGTF